MSCILCSTNVPLMLFDYFSTYFFFISYYYCFHIKWLKITLFLFVNPKHPVQCSAERSREFHLLTASTRTTILARDSSSRSSIQTINSPSRLHFVQKLMQEQLPSHVSLSETSQPSHNKRRWSLKKWVLQICSKGLDFVKMFGRNITKL